MNLNDAADCCCPNARIDTTSRNDSFLANKTCTLSTFSRRNYYFVFVEFYAENGGDGPTLRVSPRTKPVSLLAAVPQRYQRTGGRDDENPVRSTAIFDTRVASTIIIIKQFIIFCLLIFTLVAIFAKRVTIFQFVYGWFLRLRVIDLSLAARPMISD